MSEQLAAGHSAPSSSSKYEMQRTVGLMKLLVIFVNGSDPDDMDDATIDFEVEYDPGPKDSEGEPADREPKDRKEVVEWVRHLYLKFGWPGSDWKKEECLRAITYFTSRFPMSRTCKEEADGRIRCLNYD
uniref:Uncharacterized protein n=1 Tax=Bionectria ochroleuca TaxID=29856 RepID=A0A8H7TLY4_BIOOC